MASLHLSHPGSTSVKCCVHPIVILNILDQFSRRSQTSDRVIGTLLGVSSEDHIEVTNSFPVPYTDTEQVAFHMEYHRNMFELHRKTSPRETIVGWYATGTEINETSHLLQDFYFREMNHSPVHITVDTTLQNGTMAINGYVSSTVTFGETKLLTHFQPIPVDLKTNDSEKIGVDSLVRAVQGEDQLIADLDHLESSVLKLQTLLSDVSNYVDQVNAGKIKGDAKIGRVLERALAAVGGLQPDQLEKLFNSSVQDLLMVVYLANLTRSQLAIAEKLQTLL